MAVKTRKKLALHVFTCIFCPFPALTPSHFQMFKLSCFHYAHNSLPKIQNLVLQDDKKQNRSLPKLVRKKPNLEHPLGRNGTLKLVVGIDMKMWMK